MQPTLYFGECLAGSLKPASFLFRDGLGRIQHRVEQVSSRGLVGYTKLRALMRLELQWDDAERGETLMLRRVPKLLGALWEIGQLDGSIRWRFQGRGFLLRRWEVTDQHTGSSAAGVIRNPLAFGTQSAELQASGAVMASLRWEDYSLALGCPRRVRSEVHDPRWSVPALVLAVIRWCALQQR